MFERRAFVKEKRFSLTKDLAFGSERYEPRTPHSGEAKYSNRSCYANLQLS